MPLGKTINPNNSAGNGPKNIAYNAYIKDIWLELPGYEFQHKIMDEKDNPRFVGRKELEDELLGYLKDGGKTGAYLITGYRGVGKTSFVERVMEKFKAGKDFFIGKECCVEKVYKIRISFGQNNLKEIDILRQIIKEIRDNSVGEGVKIYKWLILGIHEKVANFKALPIIIAVTYILLLALTEQVDAMVQKWLPHWFCGLIPSKTPNNIEEAGGLAINAIMISLIFLYILMIVKNARWGRSLKIYDDLESLYSRCQSEVEEEVGLHGAGEKFPFGFVNKQKKKFELANPKEVENEIIETLSKSIFNYKQFVFIFDEIDKVDPFKSNGDYSQDIEAVDKNLNSSQQQNFRERKRLVINILANLKYLITTAKAKFIFIAGREMFDAALADIADRQSAVSSIFHQVINVDSFLKDNVIPERTTGTTGIVEEYLEAILLNGVKPLCDTSQPFLKRWYETLERDASGLSTPAKFKIEYTLQNFIIYLTYRSSGSPKKLVRLIEDLIQKPNIKIANKVYNDEKNLIISLGLDTTKNKGENSYYIRFDTDNQFRIGLINYLYRPMLISFGRHRHSFSDRLMVSTPFLMDHIMKFHPFAFSLQNLELIPEVISEARTPELRYFIEDLVGFLSLNQIRDTEIGLFEYKFLHKTFSEITYLCSLQTPPRYFMRSLCWLPILALLGSMA